MHGWDVGARRAAPTDRSRPPSPPRCSARRCCSSTTVTVRTGSGPPWPYAAQPVRTSSSSATSVATADRPARHGDCRRLAATSCRRRATARRSGTRRTDPMVLFRHAAPVRHTTGAGTRPAPPERGEPWLTRPPTPRPRDRRRRRAPAGLTRRGLLGGGAASALGLAMTGSLGGLARAGGAEAAVTTASTGPASATARWSPDPAGLLSPAEAVPLHRRRRVGRHDAGRRRGVAGQLRRHGRLRPTGRRQRAGRQPRDPRAGRRTSTGSRTSPASTYDPGVHGGTTTIEVDADGGRVREYVSLAGSSTNCAGGRTPWNTWLTCEETFEPVGATKPHGYVFEVDPFDQSANQDPAPIVALGRFEHEAVAVDPDTGQIYETEDSNDPHGLLYRWTPPDRRAAAGQGQPAAPSPTTPVSSRRCRPSTDGTWVPDLCVATKPGTTYDVRWRPVPEPQPGHARRGRPQAVQRHLGRHDLHRPAGWEHHPQPQARGRLVG